MNPKPLLDAADRKRDGTVEEFAITGQEVAQSFRGGEHLLVHQDE